jgi:uncharacterized protein (DUF1697 family)
VNRFILLLRAVNVGGTGKLPMADLKSMCEEIGFRNVRTYIASGNVIVDTSYAVEIARDKLSAKLLAYAGKPIGVLMRTPQELQQLLIENPFPDAAGNRNLVTFLEQAPPADFLKTVTGQRDEKIAVGKREIYVNYGAGMGTSKLKMPAAVLGTARNMNTVVKLVEMAQLLLPGLSAPHLAKRI